MKHSMYSRVTWLCITSHWMVLKLWFFHVYKSWPLIFLCYAVQLCSIVYQAADNNIFIPGPHPELLVLPAHLGVRNQEQVFLQCFAQIWPGCRTAGLPGDSISPVYYKPIIYSQLSNIGSLSEQVSWVAVQNATHFKPPPGNKIKCTCR